MIERQHRVRNRSSVRVLRHVRGRLNATSRASSVRASATASGRFDRERVLLYVAAGLILALISTLYIAGYLVPVFGFARAIVKASSADQSLPTGCYLLFMEHANRLQSVYAIRFLGMVIGAAIAFIGMMFTIKGLEAGYALDVRAASTTASLKTASPGLALCTFGAGLVVACVLHSSDLTFSNLGECFR
jgi:hypothetical protein